MPVSNGVETGTTFTGVAIEYISTGCMFITVMRSNRAFINVNADRSNVEIQSMNAVIVIFETGFSIAFVTAFRAQSVSIVVAMKVIIKTLTFDFPTFACSSLSLSIIRINIPLDRLVSGRQ